MSEDDIPKRIFCPHPVATNTTLQALDAKWKPILDQVDIPSQDDRYPRTFTEVILTQDVPDPAYVVGVSPMQAPSPEVWKAKRAYDAAKANTTAHDSKIDVLNTMYEYYDKKED